MFKILDNIYIWAFLVNIESVLLLALVKYMLFSHFTQNCIFLYFFEAKNPYFVTKNCWKSSYICVFILSKIRRNWFYKNLYNSGMVGRRKLPDSSLNRIFNALSIGVQYTLSFQWTNFGLKCLLLAEAKFPFNKQRIASSSSFIRSDFVIFAISRYQGVRYEFFMKNKNTTRTFCSWKPSKKPKKTI